MTAFGQAALRLDKRLVIKHVDATFYARFACVESDVVGVSLEDLVSPRDRKGALLLSTAVHRHTGGTIDVAVGLRINGRDIPARVRLAPDADGWQMLVEALDGPGDLVSRLAAGDHHFVSMLRHSVDGVALLDPQNCLVQHNARFFELLRVTNDRGIALTENAVAGRDLVTLIPPGAFPKVVRALRAGLPEGIQEDERVERAHVAGRLLELRVSPVDVPLRGRTGALAFLRDVTQQRELEERDQRLRADIEDARTFQQAMLPPAMTLSGYDVDVAFRPVDRVGGDFYDVVRLASSVRALVFDATGHGVRAALATILIRSEYEAIKLQAWSPARALSDLNDRIVSSYRSLDLVFTAAVVDVQLSSGEFQLASGAHPLPLLASAGAVREVGTIGSFLGVTVGARFEETKGQLEPGDSIFMLTDGVEEAMSANGARFGEENLRQAIASESTAAKAPANAVLNRLLTYISPRVPDDDIVVLAIRRQ